MSTTSRLFIILFSFLFMNFDNGSDDFISDILKKFDLAEFESNFTIVVSVKKQKLYLLNNSELIKEFDISTSKYGVGFESESFKTPLGLHTIKKKIGDNVPLNGVFKYRKFSGDVSIPNDPLFLDQDLITTRIMWLSGSEDSNRHSYDRFIYIHGTPEEFTIGKPSSHGCIRMLNADIYALYEIVDQGTPVIIR